MLFPANLSVSTKKNKIKHNKNKEQKRAYVNTKNIWQHILG